MFPDWLLATMFVAGFLGVHFGVAWRNTKRQILQTLSRRQNLTEAQFITLMTVDVSEETARFLWQVTMPYLEFHKPTLAPHPDDDLVNDLPIDDEEWSMDWPRDWAERRGFHESNLPDWPEEWRVTIRNYGRWLDMGPH